MGCRGGSYYYSAVGARSANRNFDPPSTRSVATGLRLVIQVEQDPTPIAQMENLPPSPQENPKVGDTFALEVSPEVTVNFKYIPAGTFTMGANKPEEASQDNPAHEVNISEGFWMAETELTQKQYSSIVSQSWSPFTNNFKTLAGDDKPMVLIGAWATKQVINSLNNKIRGKYEFRLPTEAEWEYAWGCRSDFRHWAQPYERYDRVGVRLVLAKKK